MKRLLVLLAAVPLLSSCSGSDPIPEPGCVVNDPVRQVRLHYDDDASTAQFSPPFADTSFEVAVRLDGELLRPVDCGSLGGVRFFFWSVTPSGFSVKVYGAGTATEPGALLYEQPVAAMLPMDWTVVALDTPVDLPGGDLWIALSYTLPGPYHASISMDEGPRVPGVNFTRLGGAWAELEHDHNFRIQALVYR